MPVRLLSSSVLKWPNAQVVDRAVRAWAHRLAREYSAIRRIGYFGSYARGDWGVGSDLDVIVIVDDAPQPFEQRARAWDTAELPVPTDVLVYTQDEWQALQNGGRWHRTLEREVIWVV